MKNMSILLKKSSIEIVHISPKLYEYIYDYVDYLLYPYRQLGYFNFISLFKDNEIIDGKYYPKKLLAILKDNIQICKQVPLDTYFCRNNIFLNGESLNFYISAKDYCNIEEKVNEYLIYSLYIHN